MDLPIKDTLVEFLCYCVVSNKQIHSNAIKVLDMFCETHDVDIKASKAYEILGDTQDKPDLSFVINSIAQTLDFEELEELKEWMCLVFTVDSDIDPEELGLARLVASRFGWRFKEIKETLNEFKVRQISENEMSMYEKRDAKIAETFLLKAKKLFTFNEAKENRIQFEIDKMALNGPLYGEAIQKRAIITKEDIEVALAYLKNTEASLTAIKHEINQLVSKDDKNATNYGSDNINETSDEYSKITSELLKYFDNEIPLQIEALQQLLIKKQKASLFFSIAFIGRTKAGKSTLHSILTNEGEGFIGVGKQRTTRFNRVYENNLIRIIDTPGLDAVDSDDGGRRDEDIALSIVDEVDVICYLVTNDNIEENEFEFLRSLRKSQKKVIVLLNFKKNIVFSYDGINYPLVNKFIANPLEWYESDGDQNIQGHINRIERWVSKYYDEKFVTIIPVHLQSAQLSRDKKFENYERELFEGSRFGIFKNAITKLIINDSEVLGSKTILNDTSVSLHHNVATLKEYQNNLEMLLDKIIIEKDTFKKNFNRDRADLYRNINNDLISMFKDLSNQSYDFAQKNWDRKEGEVQKKWEKYFENDFNISYRIKDIYERQIETLVQDVSSRIDDISSSLDSFVVDTSTSFDLKSVFDTKRFARFLGGGLGLAGSLVALISLSNPIGIGLLVIGGGLSLISGLFKSKATKRKENTEAIMKMTDQSIENIKHKVLNSYVSDLTPTINDIDDKITTLLTTMADGIQSALDEVTKFNDITMKSCQSIDHSYGKRLLEKIVKDDVNKTHVLVERNIEAENQCLKITSKFNVPVHKAKLISEVVQHDINFAQFERA